MFCLSCATLTTQTRRRKMPPPPPLSPYTPHLTSNKKTNKGQG